MEFLCRFWNLASPLWAMFQWHSTPCTNTRRSVTHKRCWRLPLLRSTKCHRGRICQWHCQSWQNPAVCLRRLNLPTAWRFMTRSEDRWSSNSWRYSMKGNKIRTSNKSSSQNYSFTCLEKWQSMQMWTTPSCCCRSSWTWWSEEARSQMLRNSLWTVWSVDQRGNTINSTSDSELVIHIINI